MLRYNFTISHVPGRELQIADALSRSPMGSPTCADQSLQLEADAYVSVVLQGLPTTEKRLLEITEAQKADGVCQKVAEYCQTQWPEKSELDAAIRPYYQVATELSVEQGLLMRGSRIVIPTPLRKERLTRIHSAHQGIVKCRERARQSMWWPGLSTELGELVKSCQECCKAQRQQPQPLTPSSFPELPWQRVGTDLFEWKQKHFFIIVDYYSRYVEIAKLQRTTAEEVIAHTKSIFAHT